MSGEWSKRRSHVPQRTRGESQQQRTHLLDTNVLLRYLVADDPPKAARVAALMERVELAQEIVEVSEAVLTETVWVLERFYKMPRNQIGERLITLLRFSGLRVGGRAILLLALHNFSSSSADFVDCILAAESTLRRVPVYTFDETDFKRLRADWESP